MRDACPAYGFSFFLDITARLKNINNHSTPLTQEEKLGMERAWEMLKKP
jgi:hypothetical protein